MSARVAVAVVAFVVIPALFGLCVDGWHGALVGAAAFPLAACAMAVVFGFVWVIAFVFQGERLDPWA